MRKPNYPLQQVVLRLGEQFRLVKELPTVDESPVLKKAHRRGPYPDISFGPSTQYEQFHSKRFFLSTNQRDSCVRINGNIAIIHNIFESKKGIFVLYSTFARIENFFTYPFESEHIGILMVSDLSAEIKVATVHSIEAKCVLLTADHKFVVFPLAHTEL